MKSTWTQKSGRGNLKTKVGSKKAVTAGEEGQDKDRDSRAGNFVNEDGDEDDTVSQGLDESRLQFLKKQLEDNVPSMALKNNEYKVRQGLQECLEDSELPADFDNDWVFEQCKTQHLRQAQATEDRKQ